jgi:hypothetical protein
MLRPSPILLSIFCTPIHKFAQTFPSISIDASNQNNYLARQIEPASLKLYGSA